MSQKSIKKEKMNSMMAKSASTNMNSGQFSQGRSLIKDQLYVIKVVDVSEVPENIANEALQEIEVMCKMESPYIVGYLDSFIDGQKINIVLEYCMMGDLNVMVEKQKMTGNKMFIENIIWKIFIHLCLGI